MQFFKISVILYFSVNNESSTSNQRLNSLVFTPIVGLCAGFRIVLFHKLNIGLVLFLRVLPLKQHVGGDLFFFAVGCPS